MVYNQLSNFLETYEPTPTRGSGIPAAKLKQLKELKLLELVKIRSKTGKLPANPNAFQLTMFGRSVVREAINQSVPKGEILNQLKSLIVNTKEDYLILSKSIEKLSSKLSLIEDALNMIDGGLSITQEKTSFNMIKFENLLVEAEKFATVKQKLGPLVIVDEYYQKIKEKLNLSDKQINDTLYELFQKGKLDLQTGPQKGKKYVLSPSGTKFQWGKYKR